MKTYLFRRHQSERTAKDNYTYLDPADMFALTCSQAEADDLSAELSSLLQDETVTATPVPSFSSVEDYRADELQRSVESATKARRKRAIKTY